MIYLIPLFALFNTLLSCYLVYRVALASPRWRNTFFETCADFVSHTFSPQEFFRQDEDSLRDLLQRRYESFIEALKQRIPLAEMVMNGPLEASLKEQVHTEMDKLLPELKKLIHLPSPAEVKALVQEHLDKSDQLDLFLAQLQRQYRLKIILCLGSISLSLGLIQLLVFLAV